VAHDPARQLLVVSEGGRPCRSFRLVRAARPYARTEGRELLAPVDACVPREHRHAVPVQAEVAVQRDRRVRVLRRVHDSARLARLGDIRRGERGRESRRSPRAPGRPPAGRTHSGRCRWAHRLLPHSRSVVLRRGSWIPVPRDWSPRTQTGARYDLSHDEGLRVWTACLERAAGLAEAALDVSPARYGAPSLHLPRLGQGIFRVKVLDAYGRACAVTEEHSLPVLEAAHIKPYASDGEHAVSNGLSLRSDLHRLFDRGYVTVDEDQRFVVGRRLKDEFENGAFILRARRVASSAAARRIDAAFGRCTRLPSRESVSRLKLASWP